MKIYGNITIGKIVNQPGSTFNGDLQEKYNVVMTGYVARNKDYTLKLFLDVKDKNEFRRYRGISYNDLDMTGYWDCAGNHGVELDYHLFPDVKWEDDYPTEVKIRIM